MKQPDGKLSRVLRALDVGDFVALLGFIAICVGVAMVSVAFAFVVGGAILLALSLVRYVLRKAV